MATSAIFRVRVDKNIKEQATPILAAMGLTVSDAVRVFLKRVAVEQAMPFALYVPNAETAAAMAEADAIVRTRRTRFDSAANVSMPEKEVGQP